VLGEEVRTTRAVEAEDVVARARGDFRGGARRQLEMGNMVDGGVDAVLLAPVMDEAVDPLVVRRNEVTSLDDFERLGVGQRRRDERRADHRRQAQAAGNRAGPPEKAAPRDSHTTRVSSFTHNSLLFLYVFANPLFWFTFPSRDVNRAARRLRAL